MSKPSLTITKLLLCQRFLQANSIPYTPRLISALAKRAPTGFSPGMRLQLRRKPQNLNQLRPDQASPLVIVLRAVLSSRRKPHWGPRSVAFVASGSRFTRKISAPLFRAKILTSKKGGFIEINDGKAQEFLARFAA